MKNTRAFLFDLNGTMIDDMNYHIRAWHDIFNRLGVTISMHETKMQCYGKNAEVIERVIPGRFSDDEKNTMSLNKEKKYQEAFRPFLKLINGLDDFLEKAKQQDIKMAIGTAAIRFNVDFVLDGLHLHDYFNVIISADDVEESKPNPQTFLKCAELLGVRPDECIVFEDAPKGAEAAERAGMRSVVITTMHKEEEFTGNNIICFAQDYTNGLFEKIMIG